MTTADDMIAGTFTAIRLVRLVLEENQPALEAALVQVVEGDRTVDVLRAATVLAAQEMTSARGEDPALAFCRAAVPPPS